jgi:putative peptidoglycan lipid II flippase
VTEDDANGGLLRSARNVSGLTLLSRVLGLARDTATAALLGASWVNDALNYAWTLPNAFRRLFGEGALSSAFVPVLSEVVEKEGRARARQVANQIVCTTGLFLMLLSAALMLAAAFVPEAWMASWLNTEDPEQARITARYLQILLPYLAAVCIVAQLMAVLNVLGEFKVPAFAQVIVNLVWIAGVGVAAWVAAGDRPMQGTIIAISVLVAAVLQFLWHLPRLRQLGVGFRVVRPQRSPELSRVTRLMGPMLLGMGAGQIAVLADNQIAIMFLGEGGRTHIYYGMRVMQFPMGLVAVALGTVVYPLLSRLVARGDREGAAKAAGLALRTDLLLTLPAAVGIVLLARPIIGLLFERGAFMPSSADLTARALEGYALGIPFAGMAILLTRLSYAMGDMRLPVRVGLIAVSVNIALDLVLVGPLGERGLAFATSISALVSACLLLRGLRSVLLPPGSPGPLAALPLIAVTAIMGAAVWGVDHWFALPATRMTDSPGLAYLMRVLAGTVCGCLVFSMLAGRYCREEWAAVRTLLRPAGKDAPPDDDASS